MAQEEKINEEAVAPVEEKAAKQTALVISEGADDGSIGSITQNVVARIITQNVLAVEGVARFAPKGASDLLNIFSSRNYDGSLVIEFKDGKVYVSLAILVYFGAIIPDVVKKIQAVIREQVEVYTGAKIGKIDVAVKDLVAPETKSVETADDATAAEVVNNEEADKML